MSYDLDDDFFKPVDEEVNPIALSNDEQPILDDEGVLSSDMFESYFGSNDEVDLEMTQPVLDIKAETVNRNLRADLLKIINEDSEKLKNENCDIDKSSLLNSAKSVFGDNSVAKEVEQSSEPEEIVSSNSDILKDIDLADLLQDIIPDSDKSEEPEQTQVEEKHEVSKTKSSLLSFLLPSENLSPLQKKTHMLKLTAIVICLVVLIVYAIVSAFSGGINSGKDVNKKLESGEQKVDTDYLNSLLDNSKEFKSTVLRSDSFTGLSEYVEDILIVDKYARVSKNGIQVYLGGSTTKSKMSIEIPVTIETYNAMKDGSLLKIQFKLIQVNGENYATEFKLLEVVG